jgi:hypothetical protein
MVYMLSFLMVWIITFFNVEGFCHFSILSFLKSRMIYFFVCKGCYHFVEFVYQTKNYNFYDIVLNIIFCCYSGSFLCDYNVNYYPFDVHTCYVKLTLVNRQMTIIR